MRVMKHIEEQLMQEEQQLHDCIATGVAVRTKVQWVAVCCSVRQCVAARCSVEGQLMQEEQQLHDCIATGVAVWCE